MARGTRLERILTRPRRRLGRIPQTVNIGAGYRVHVVLLAPSQLAEIADDEEENWSAGCWIVDDMTIYIDNTLPRSRQWATYWHELLHAVHDVTELHSGGL